MFWWEQPRDVSLLITWDYPQGWHHHTSIPVQLTPPPPPLSITVLVIIPAGLLFICCFSNITVPAPLNTVMSLVEIVVPGKTQSNGCRQYGHLNGLNQSYDNSRMDLTIILSDLAIPPISNVLTFWILILAFTKLKMASSSLKLIISVFLSLAAQVDCWETEIVSMFYKFSNWNWRHLTSGPGTGEVMAGLRMLIFPRCVLWSLEGGAVDWYRLVVFTWRAAVIKRLTARWSCQQCQVSCHLVLDCVCITL